MIFELLNRCELRALVAEHDLAVDDKTAMSRPTSRSSCATRNSYRRPRAHDSAAANAVTEVEVSNTETATLAS